MPPANSSQTTILTSIGHALAFVKINNEWYITDNEHGMLQKISDLHLINILLLNLYKNGTFTITNEKDNNLVYRFDFVDKDNNKLYYYPDITFNQNELISRDITPNRVILFTHHITQGNDDIFMNKILNYFDKDISNYIQKEIKSP